MVWYSWHKATKTLSKYIRLAHVSHYFIVDYNFYSELSCATDAYIGYDRTHAINASVHENSIKHKVRRRIVYWVINCLILLLR